MATFYIDGDYVPAEEARIPTNDLAVLRGYGVFDFMRTYHCQPFRLDAHIDRLFQSAALIEMDELPWSQKDIADIVRETLRRNDHGESNIRIVVTGGISRDNITPGGNPRLLVMVTPAQALPQSWYTDGVKIMLNETERYLPGSKSIHYIPAIIALKKAKEMGAIEAVYVDRHGKVREGTTTNIFAVIDGTLITPEIDILPGITRQVVMELADVTIRDITVEDLLQADEVFITASNKEIVPVVQVEDTIIADGQVGTQTRDIMQIFAEVTWGR